MDPNVPLYEELPPFANKENRELHAKLIERNRDLTLLKNECSELNDRMGVLTEHLKSVTTEVKSTQELLNAKSKQATEEKHLQQLSERELGILNSEIAKIEKETVVVQSRWSEIQAKIFKSQQRIESFKEEAKINEEQLNQWIQAARDKEEDYLVMQRYKREDEGKVRTTLLEIEKTTQLFDQKKAELENEVTATRSLQIELDMTAEQFRKLHEERKQLLSQWEGTLEQLRSLNYAIEKSTSSYEERKETARKYIEMTTEQRKNMERAEADNQDLERKLRIGDHQVSQKHKQYETDSASLLEFHETVETQRHSLEKTEGDVRAVQAEIDSYRAKTQEEINKKQRFIARLEETKNALYAQKDWSEDLGQQTNVMNELLKKEESTLKDLEKSIETEKNQIFKLGQQVYDERKKEKNLLAEMQGAQSRAKNLQQKIHEFDRETQKQEELKYNSNFQIQQMERKISRIEGDRTEEEKIELQAQIDRLSGVLKDKMNIEKLLAQQLHRLDLDLRQTERRKEGVLKVKQYLETKLNELRLDQDSLDNSTNRSRQTKENVLVQINMLRLQVERLSDQVANKSDEMISLENRRKQLQLSMEERIHEIDAHLVGLRTQLKTEEEARHSSNVELQERKKRSETLQSKYEVMMGKYKVDGEEVSQSYHVIKFAQEREEVSRRGDQLEVEVKNAVKELRALERAMNKLNGQNTTFREGFTSISNDDSDMDRKKTLEDQRKVIQQRLASRQTELRHVFEERNALEKAYQQQQDRINQLQSDVNRMKPTVDKVSQENNELKEKIKRASLGLTKAKETHRAPNNVPSNAKYPSTLLEMDIELKMERSMIENTISELTSLAENNREIEPKLRLALSQIGINMKQLPSIASRSIAKSPSNGYGSQTGSRPTSNHSARSITSTGSKGSIVSVQSIGSELSVQSNSSQRGQTSQGPRITKPGAPIARPTTPRRKGVNIVPK